MCQLPNLPVRTGILPVFLETSFPNAQHHLCQFVKTLRKELKNVVATFQPCEQRHFWQKFSFNFFLKWKDVLRSLFFYFFIFKLQFLKNCYFVFRPRKLGTLKPFLLDLIVISSTKQKKLAIKVNVWKLSCKKKRFTVRKFILITYLVRFRIMMMMMMIESLRTLVWLE